MGDLEDTGHGILVSRTDGPGAAALSVRDVEEWFGRPGRLADELAALTARRRAEEATTIRSARGVASGRGPADPTASKAVAIMGARELEERTAAELDAAVERCAAVCNGVAMARGAAKGAMLMDHYVHGRTWESISRDYDVPMATLFRWRNSTFEWISYVGLAAAAEGIGRAESRERWW